MIAEHRFERIGAYVYPRFEPSLPSLDSSGADVARHQVAVVGGGPVGLATALGLAQHGVRSVIIEADDSVCMGSRAACVSRRSLEIIGRLGAQPAFLEKGLPWTDGRSYYKQTEVFHFSMPNEGRRALPAMVNLQQYYIEQYLVDAVHALNERQPGTIDIRWATEVQAMHAGKDGVTLEVSNPLGSYKLDADYVVACDGGQSTVRKQLGLDLHGTAYNGRYLIIDIELPSSYPTERRAWFDPPWNRGSTVLMHRQPDDIWRVDYQLRHGEPSDVAMQPENMHAFVQRHLDAIGEGHLDWKPVWSSIYRAGAMTLDSYRHGRVLFAGNAAHAMPIFGVRGLNSGFDDSDNLAWKLAFVCHGLAPASLLDTYSSERIEAFNINAENAMRSTEFMSPPSRGFDLFREAALSLAEDHRHIAKLVNPRQTSAVAYSESALSSASDAFAAGPAPGEVLIDMPAAGAAGSLCSALGPHFTCLVFSASGAVPRAVTILDESHGAPLKVLRISPQPVNDDVRTLLDADGYITEAYGASKGAVYLVRPDGHVAGRWHDPDAATLLRSLARACGLASIEAKELA